MNKQITENIANGKKKVRIRWRFSHRDLFLRMYSLFAVTLAVALVINFLNINDNNIETVSAEYVFATDSLKFNAVFVRDETIMSAVSNYGQAQNVLAYTVPDGGKVVKDMPVANIYDDTADIKKIAENADQKQKLTELKKIVNQGTKNSAHISHLSQSLDRRYFEVLETIEKGDFTQISSQISDFENVVGTLDFITKDADDSKTDEFSREIKSLQTQLDSFVPPSPRGSVFADSNGYFVSHTDGFEGRLRAEKIDEILTADIREAEILADLDTVNLQKEEAFSTFATNSSNNVGKIISDYDFYIVAIFPNNEINVISEIAKSTVLKIKFEPKRGTVPCTLEAIRPIENSDESIVIMRSDEYLSELSRYRAVKAEIFKQECEGIKVPKDAVRFKTFEESVKNDDDKPILNSDGENPIQFVEYCGVYVLVGDDVRFKKILPLYSGDADYEISSLYTENLNGYYLNLYDLIIVKGVGADGEH